MENFGFAVDIFRNVQGTYPWFIIYLCILLYYMKKNRWNLVKTGMLLWILLFFNDIAGVLWAGVGSLRSGIFRFSWMMCMVILIAIFCAERIWESKKNKIVWILGIASLIYISVLYSPKQFYQYFPSYNNLYQINEDLIETINIIVKDADIDGEQNPYVMGDYTFLEKARLYNPAIILLESYYESFKLTDSRQNSGYKTEEFPVLANMCKGGNVYTVNEKKKAIKNTTVKYIVIKRNEFTDEYQQVYQDELNQLGKNMTYDIYKIQLDSENYKN